MIIGSWNNKFHMGYNKWFISFDKNNQEIFNILTLEKKEIFLTTGPGSFIGTRSITALALGYSFSTNIKIYGFNLLLDILPTIYAKDHTNHDVWYIYGELNRFFYCIHHRDLAGRKFLLLTPQQVDEICTREQTCGNYHLCHIYYDLEYGNITSTIEFLYNGNKEKYIFEKIEYFDKYI